MHNRDLGIHHHERARQVDPGPVVRQVGAAGVGVFGLLRTLLQNFGVYASFNGGNALVQGIASRKTAERDRYAHTVGTLYAYASPDAGITWTSADSTGILGKDGQGVVIGLNVAHSNPGSVIVGTSDGNVQWSNNVFTGANCTPAMANTASFACTANSAASWANLTGGNAVLPNRAIPGVAFAPNSSTFRYSSGMLARKSSTNRLASAANCRAWGDALASARAARESRRAACQVGAFGIRRG